MKLMVFVLIAWMGACSGVVHAAMPAVSTLDGEPYALLSPDRKATAIVFLGTTCPIANAAAPTLNALHEQYAAKGIAVVGVYSDPTLTRAEAIAHREEYELTFPALFDASAFLARSLKPTHTPFAVLLDANGREVYRGRIDDAYATLGRPRQVITSPDLQNAIEDVLAGRAVRTAKTDVVGCLFEAWDRPPAGREVTWSRDIAPIVYANCLSCHREGQAAPFALRSYEDVAKRAELIASVVEDRYMPPWKPVAGFGEFHGERRLSADEIALFRAFADANAPQGNPDDAPKPPDFPGGWALGEPDLILEMPQPFDIPAGGRDIYRAFVIPIDIPEDKYVVAMEFRPGAPSVVHHAIFFLDDDGQARRLDARDAGPGYRSFGGPGFTPSGGLGGWAPGVQPEHLPDGIGRPVTRGSDLVMQIHYHPDGKRQRDQSRLALYFATKPIREKIITIPLANRQIDIPPGKRDHVVEASFTTPLDAKLFGVMPHMHLLGREMKVEATTDDGSTIPLIHIDDWDFRWQDQYRFREPVRIPRGSTVRMRAVFDNSTDNPSNPSNPPKRVRWGEQTTDEMAICFLNVLVPAELDLRQLRERLRRLR